MEKLIYLLTRSDDVEGLGRQLREQTVPELQQEGVQHLVLNLADMDATVSAQAPERIAGPWQTLGAVVSFWVDNVDQREALEPILAQTGCSLEGFLVTESVPQPCERNWPLGEKRPGVTQFTAHGKPAEVSEDDFYRNWSEHTSLSFDLHPLRWSYVRNAVARPLNGAHTTAARPFRALVWEHFKATEDFTDESRYFGKPEVVQQMYQELTGFCDVYSMVTGPMSEYWFE